MCSPVAAASIGGGASALNIIQQRQDARAQNKFNLSQFRINRDEALRSMVESIREVQRRGAQEQVSTSQALLQLTREANEARGVVRATGSSVEGNTVTALLDDFTRQELIREEVLNTNLENTQDQLQNSILEIQSQTRTRINSGFGTPVQGPSLLGAAVQIGTSAFSGFLQAGGGKQ